MCLLTELEGRLQSLRTVDDDVLNCFKITATTALAK